MELIKPIKISLCLVCTMFLTGCMREIKHKDYDDNICYVVKHSWGWRQSLKSASRVYGISPGLILSTIYHESSFRPTARPPRGKVLGVIPWRYSTAYGFGQVKDETWEWYKEKNQLRFVSRTSFYDTVHFIGWYYSIFKSRAQKVADPYYSFYIAYHDGIGGFLRHSEEGNEWLQNKAKSVKAFAESYDQQLKDCL